MIRTGAPPSALPKAKTADDLTITAEKKNTHTKSGNKGGIRRYPKEQNHFYLRSHKRPRGGTTHPTNRRSRRGAIRQGSPTFEDSTSTGVDHARIGKWVPPSVPGQAQRSELPTQRGEIQLHTSKKRGAFFVRLNGHLPLLRCRSIQRASSSLRDAENHGVEIPLYTGAPTRQLACMKAVALERRDTLPLRRCRRVLGSALHGPASRCENPRPIPMQI